MMESIYCVLALSVVSSLFLEGQRILLLSRGVGALILFFIGIYLYRTNLTKEISSGVRKLRKRAIKQMIKA